MQACSHVLEFKSNVCPRGHLAVRKFLCQFNMLQFNAVLLLLCTKSFHLQTDDDNTNRSVLLGNFEMHLHEMLLANSRWSKIGPLRIGIQDFWVFFRILGSFNPRNTYHNHIIFVTYLTLSKIASK